jgi:cytochrome c biogenesis protein ResB
MNDNLKEIFQNVNDWLKFAEAKHAGLIVLNSGTIFGLISIYKDYKGTLTWFIVFISVLLFGISMLLSFISIFPRMKISVKEKSKIDTPNLYFFKHLAHLKVKDLKTKLEESDKSFHANELDEDLMNQIIVNSQITVYKSNLFRAATICTISGLVIPLIVVFIKKMTL